MPKNSSPHPEVGYCIYCNANGAHTKLTDEHVVPLSLGGRHLLRRASCDQCAETTSAFEGRVSSKLWGVARTQLKMPSRRKKGRTVAARATETNSPSEVSADDFPTIMAWLDMPPAEAVLELPPSGKELTGTMGHTIISGPDMPQFRGATIGNTITLANFQVNDYIRCLAKIAHCHAIYESGYGSFRPTLLDIILKGQMSMAKYYIGGSRWKFEVPGNVDYSLELAHSFGMIPKMLVVKVHLFPQYNFPPYDIVVGTAD